ncbi:MAG: EAL domain-containing protein, partial [Pseudomonadota bacterium]
LDSLPGIFYLIDQDLRFRRWNQALEEVTGYSHAEMSLIRATDLFSPEHQEGVHQAVQMVLETGEASLEAPLLTKSGAVHEFSYFGRRVEVAGELMIAGTGVDNTRLRDAQRLQATQSRQLQHLASNVPGVIYQLRRDPESGCYSMPYASAKIFEVLGVHHEEVVDDAQHLFDKIAEDDAERVNRAVDISARRLTPFQEQFRIMPPGGDFEHAEWVEVESSPERQPDGAIIWHGFARLITARRRMEDELTRLAYQDSLTGLPNRSWLQLLLEEQISDASLLSKELALLHLDLDNFKEINDIWGHGTGDRMLNELAERLLDVIGERGRMGRLGGDEFLIMIQEDEARNPARQLAAALCAAMDAPLSIEGHEVRVTASVGISLFPHDGETAEDLMRHSDAALHRAKEEGTGTWALYSPELTAKAMARRYLETELRAAVDRQEIQVALQPIIDLDTREVVGHEALARWHHKDDGWIDPEQFIMLAESRGLVAQLGEQVYAKAMRAMISENYPGVLAINVAPMQLRDPQFARRLFRMAKEAGLEPERIEVEITERAFMENPEKHQSQLQALRNQGIRVIIDDFGTGYSSLAYLRKLPIQGLKIDRIFVQDVGSNFKNAAIVKAVVTLANELGIAATAEGIQTDEELEIIRSFGCHIGQGWYFGRGELIPD